MDVARWLARVQHDLVKRLLWSARDRRDLGGAPAPGELVASLVDEVGQPIAAEALWAALLADYPSLPKDLATDLPTSLPTDLPNAGGGAAGGGQRVALDLFERTLTQAIAASQAGDVEGVLALEPAFSALARSLEEQKH